MENRKDGRIMEKTKVCRRCGKTLDKYVVWTILANETNTYTLCPECGAELGRFFKGYNVEKSITDQIADEMKKRQKKPAAVLLNGKALDLFDKEIPVGSVTNGGYVLMGVPVLYEYMPTENDNPVCKFVYNAESVTLKG